MAEARLTTLFSMGRWVADHVVQLRPGSYFLDACTYGKASRRNPSNHNVPEDRQRTRVGHDTD